MTGFGNGERDNVRLREYLERNPHHSPNGTGYLTDFTLDVTEEKVHIEPPETVTAEAERLTQAARHHSYGHPADDFAKVTGMALALWGRGPETPKEHAMYLILVKLSREAHEHKRDNLVDIAGYARTIEMIAERESASLSPP